MGYIMTYNYTSNIDGRNVAWDRHALQPRKNAICPDLCGQECNADQTECYDVPQLDHCYNRTTNGASPRMPHTLCATKQGTQYCADDYTFQIDGGRKTWLQGVKKVTREKLVDCDIECRQTWLEKHMKSACSHINTNPKSRHYNEKVPCGYYWHGKELVEDGWPHGRSAACRLDTYPI